jgi:tetratricopeptide (TPR) repeat protein
LSKLLVILFSLTFLSVPLFGQEDNCKELSDDIRVLHINFSKVKKEKLKNQIDSLYQIIPKNCDEAYLLANNVIGRYHRSIDDNDTAEKYFIKSLEYANKISYVRMQKHNLMLLANIEKERGNKIKALGILDSAFQLPCNIDSLSCIKSNITNVINQAGMHVGFGEYEKAIKKYLLGEKEIIDTGFGDSIYRVAIYNGLSNIYDDFMREHRVSLNYMKKALRYCPNGHPVVFKLYNNIGNRYSELMKYDSARVFFEKTLSGSDKVGNHIVPCQNIGEIMLIKENYQEAINYFRKAVENSEKVKHAKKLLDSKILLGKAYYLNNQFSDADIVLKEVKNAQKVHLSETHQKYYFFNKIALLDPTLSQDFYNHLAKMDSIQGEERVLSLNNSVAKYEKLLLRDSLQKAVLLRENEETKVKNYRLSSAAMIMGLLLLGGLVYQFRNLFIGQKTRNKELVFKNQELENLNQKLRERSTAIQEKKRIIPVASNIQFKSNDKTFIIEPDRVRYVQAEAEGTRIFFDQEDRWTDLSLKQLNNQLTDDLFIQVFRSTIVNLQHIDWINTTTLQMKDGTKLKIGRTYKKKIQKALGSEEE